MKNVIHRPCVVCMTGHFKCNARSSARTCSKECSKIYAKNSAAFTGFDPLWYTALDLLPMRRALVVRVGNAVMFKFEIENAAKLQSGDVRKTF